MTRILGSSFSLQQKQVRSDTSCYLLHCSALTHCCILLTQRQGGWTRHLGLRWTSRSPLISHICTLFYRSSLNISIESIVFWNDFASLWNGTLVCWSSKNSAGCKCSFPYNMRAK
jgi:hypothetical protein